MPASNRTAVAGERLTTALAWLDTLLERAAATARDLYGPEAAGDPYRGMLVGHDQPAQLLARQPGLPLLTAGRRPDTASGAAPLAALREAFELSDFDIALCVIALAPELDLRYERLYGYLQDDVGRRRATVDLALNLLCVDAAEKLERRSRLASDAPLVRHGVLDLLADPRHVDPPLLAHYLKLDGQLIALLLGQTALAPPLADSARLIEEPAGEWPEALPRFAIALARAAADERRAMTIWIEGAAGSGRASAAAALAAALARPLLELDAAAGPSEAGVAAALRYARLTGALVHIRHLDAVGPGPVLDAVRESSGPVVVSGTVEARPDADLRLVLPSPTAAERRAVWKRETQRAGMAVPEPVLDALAARFTLERGQIAAAASHASTDARLEGEEADPAVLFAAARARRGDGLARLARKVEPVRGWGDLVLPDDRVEQLRELCSWVRHRARVFEHWGFDRKLGSARGVNALFSGAPGTGKTLAAEVIAGDLGLDLYRIDLSTIVSKYIGETEKNLARVFAEAQDSNAILLFDEADALFGKRSEVHDAHDRFANIEISYLLQRMEEYDGVALLTTNRRRDLDDAFARRLNFAINFPLPDPAQRRRIWDAIWPADVPRAPDLDLEVIASRVELAGGNIRNIALAAAFLAAGDGRRVTIGHLLSAARREYRNLGVLVDDRQFELEG